MKYQALAYSSNGNLLKKVQCNDKVAIPFMVEALKSEENVTCILIQEYKKGPFGKLSFRNIETINLF